MRTLSNGKGPTKRAIAITALVLAGLIVAGFLYVRPIAPKLAPMRHFKTERGAGCFAMALAACQTSFYYVAEGDMTTVMNQVYEVLSKNDNYNVEPPDDSGLLYVKYKDVDPNEQDESKKGFGIEFVTPPAPSDEYQGFFIPTDTCRVGSTNCVEALIVK